MDKEQKIRLLEEKIRELEKSLSAKEKECAASDKASGGDAHLVFERNILLQDMVNRRTKELEDSNRKLTGEIKERTKTEEALRDSENFLLQLLDSIPVPVFYKDIEGRYKGFNKAFEKIFGLTRKDLLGKTVQDFASGLAVELNIAKDRELFEKGEIQQYETQVTAITGETRYVSFHKAVLTDYKGEITGLVGTAFDITEYKRAREELERSRKNYKDIFDNAIEGIFQSTPDRRLRKVNPAFARMFGYGSPEEVIAGISDIATQIYADSEEFRKVRNILEEKGSVEDYEVQVKRKDGSVFWVSANLRSVYDDNSNLLYNEGSILDITEHKLAAIERDKLIDALQDALAHVKTLSGTASYMREL